MKYSEFEKRITEWLGFRAENRIDCIDVVKSNYLVGRVNKKYRYNLTLRTSGIINDDAACYLAQMCHELACTPLEDREDEKKYRLKFSGFSNEPSAYISKRMNTGDYKIKMLGGRVFQYEFTEKEIEAFPDEVQEHAHKCEWEEVE